MSSWSHLLWNVHISQAAACQRDNSEQDQERRKRQSPGISVGAISFQWLSGSLLLHAWYFKVKERCTVQFQGTMLRFPTKPQWHWQRTREWVLTNAWPQSGGESWSKHRPCGREWDSLSSVLEVLILTVFSKCKIEILIPASQGWQRIVTWVQFFKGTWIQKVRLLDRNLICLLVHHYFSEQIWKEQNTCFCKHFASSFYESVIIYFRSIEYAYKSKTPKIFKNHL